MGKHYEAVVQLQLTVQFDSPEGAEALRRAKDIADVLVDRLPPKIVYRTRRGGSTLSPHVTGTPRVVGEPAGHLIGLRQVNC